MPKAGVLHNALELYSESWKTDHRDAMECWDLEGRLKISLSLYDYISSIDRHWSETVQGGQRNVAVTDAEEIIDFYRTWLQPADEVAQSIRTMRRKGFEVSGADEFVEACRRARFAVSVDIEHVFSADEQIKAGGLRSSKQVLDGLRSRLSRHRKRGTR